MDQKTGYVTAVSGGRGEKSISHSFNRATQARRSPGSVFKVLASFAPALDIGKITAASVIDDRPYSYGTSNPPYSPSNHWGSEYRGLTTIRDAIKTSANVVSVQNMYRTGIDDCFMYLLNFGFTSLQDEVDENGNTDRVLSTALGGLTYGVYNSEVTAAYASIANHGYLNRAKFYVRVLDRDGNVVLDNTVEADPPKQVLKPGNAYILTDMMRDVITGTGGATGTAAKFTNSNMPISGKTGTTSDDKDLYFVGYTPYYTAGIWFGYDDNKPMHLNNQRYHLVIWRTIMERIHEGFEVVEFERPENIIEVSVCRDSGMLPSSLCSSDARGGRVSRELFVSGTQPVEYCSTHQALTVCTVSGMRPNEYCPSSVIGNRVGIVKGDHYTGTAFIRDSAYELYVGGTCNVHGPNNAGQPIGVSPEGEGGQPIVENEAGQGQEQPQQGGAPDEGQPEGGHNEEPEENYDDGGEITIEPPDSGSEPPFMDDFFE
jgi:penicillin-binding protein 1A